MLRLLDIKKDYGKDDNIVHALKGVSLDFRDAEFVSILGASGCGKTTMLNIIGGLDKYTSGDLVINGRSTKSYKDKDWDFYRNQTIGFVFQSYNLIPHLNILSNVEIALTLTGISKKARKARAKKALISVGLKDQLNKKPNQLSGGQMQRVAIARALVNNPKIILADEPTGALDTETSVQIMEILKEISKDKLIIMVTHNPELANKYSSRIIKVTDGNVESDNNPLTEEEINTLQAKEKPVTITKNKRKKTSMNYFTAFGLSLKNLFSKKGRTIITAFAGSIGIIGIALVLAIANGFNGYIGKLQSETLGGYPITINRTSVDLNSMMKSGTTTTKYEEYPADNKIVVYNQNEVLASMLHINIVNNEYVQYVNNINPELVSDISLCYDIPLNVITYNGNAYTKVDTSSSTNTITSEKSGLFYQGLDNVEFVNGAYDTLSGHYPTNKNEVALVVDNYNRLDMSILNSLGIPYTLGGKIDFDTIVNHKEFKVVLNDNYYLYNEGEDAFTEQPSTEYGNLYNSDESITLTVVGVLRQKKDSPLGLLNSGIMYTPMLTDYLLADARESEIVNKQNAPTNTKIYVPILTDNGPLTNYSDAITYFQSYGVTIDNTVARETALQYIGGSLIPTTIFLYPKDFKTKSGITDYLDQWNTNNTDSVIYYTDSAALLGDSLGSLVDIISYVLIAFAAVSLVVSSIMISIITYVSVIERTKEIGVLRSLGARKKDISRVFNAETLLIGFFAGLFGIIITYALCPLINLIIGGITGGNAMVKNIASLNIIHALILIAISMILTMISGFIPSKIASKKDPVKALRTE